MLNEVRALISCSVKWCIVRAALATAGDMRRRVSILKGGASLRKHRGGSGRSPRAMAISRPTTTTRRSCIANGTVLEWVWSGVGCYCSEDSGGNNVVGDLSFRHRTFAGSAVTSYWLLMPRYPLPKPTTHYPTHCSLGYNSTQSTVATRSIAKSKKPITAIICSNITV